MAARHLGSPGSGIKIANLLCTVYCLVGLAHAEVRRLHASQLVKAGRGFVPTLKAGGFPEVVSSVRVLYLPAIANDCLRTCRHSGLAPVHTGGPVFKGVLCAAVVEGAWYEGTKRSRPSNNECQFVTGDQSAATSNTNYFCGCMPKARNSALADILWTDTPTANCTQGYEKILYACKVVIRNKVFLGWESIALNNINDRACVIYAPATGDGGVGIRRSYGRLCGPKTFAFLTEETSC